MKPTVARNVHYQAYGTPGGEFQSVARAAIITDVAALVPDATLKDPLAYGDERNYRVGVCVLNPSGIFFNAACPFDPDGKPGTWRWPPRE
jgi:hypothetical protein